jgi:hypothetical protein
MVMLLSNFVMSDKNLLRGPTVALLEGGGERSVEILRRAKGALLRMTISFFGCGGI